MKLCSEIATGGKAAVGRYIHDTDVLIFQEIAYLNKLAPEIVHMSDDQHFIAWKFLLLKGNDIQN